MNYRFYPIIILKKGPSQNLRVNVAIMFKRSRGVVFTRKRPQVPPTAPASATLKVALNAKIFILDVSYAFLKVFWFSEHFRKISTVFLSNELDPTVNSPKFTVSTRTIECCIKNEIIWRIFKKTDNISEN